jgi:hypothetical protein
MSRFKNEGRGNACPLRLVAGVGGRPCLGAKAFILTERCLPCRVKCWFVVPQVPLLWILLWKEIKENAAFQVHIG